MQLINLCKILLDSEDSSEELKTRGSELIIGLGIDAFILNQVSSLDQLDLLHAVDVFSNSTLTEVQQAIEMHLI